MNVILPLLFILVAIFFCVGLIVPKTINQNLNRKKVFGISIGLFMLLGFISAQLPDEPKQVGPKIQAVEIKPEEVAFDIPSFVKSKTVEEVVAVLGTPEGNTEPTGFQVQSGAAEEWEKTFASKKGEKLLVTYNPKTRAIVDYFISHNTTSTAVLLKLGNLNPEAREYVLEPVQALSLPLGNYTGIKVTPRR